MNSNFGVIGASLFVCGSCYAQAPTSDVQAPSITNSNSSMKLEDSTPVMLRTSRTFLPQRLRLVTGSLSASSRT
jgi:hypothetical protein